MEVVGSEGNIDNDEVVTQPKVKPIMLRFKKNFNLILQHLNRKYSDSVNKLTGEYIKITAASIDQHGEITKELKEKEEEFYAVPPLGDRPLKMVMKGLPSTTDIDDIKSDLANQGLPVMKVAQLTQRKSKFPLPLFLVEVRKNVPDSRDIRDISTCCYMSITWDSFRRRPGPSQCYNCNYFHHSSLNCEIKTRCLKNDRISSTTHASGGTAILIKSSLKHHHFLTPPLGVVEATAVVLTPPDDEPLIIASIYISPSTNPSIAISDLEDIFCLGHSSLFCGDYNAHHADWGCVSNNQRGINFKFFLDSTDTDILAPPTPTRFGYNSASTIDFALTRHFHWRTSVNSVSELSSDHNPIILNFKTSIKFDFSTRTVTTDWHHFRHTLKTTTNFQPITAHSREDIEKLTTDLTSNILHAYNSSSKPVKNNNKFYFDSDLFKQRNRARKLWQ
ncbi:probable RNA-directed DNA polymerase from transposon X-element [Trichonephila clavipes]|nr:probable RNA-directed DNA polymerase from transposon X-element [Trichonephila clavipes]